MGKADQVDVACPLLGLLNDRRTHFTFPQPRHRCYSSQAPAPISPANQAKLCLAPAFVDCERYREWESATAAGRALLVAEINDRPRRVEDQVAGHRAADAKPGDVAAAAAPKRAAARGPAATSRRARASVPPSAPAPGAAAARPSPSTVSSQTTAPEPAAEPAADPPHVSPGPRRRRGQPVAQPGDAPSLWSAHPPLSPADTTRDQDG